ncbi:MAG TPA: AMP-binding protein [Smithellaceae bacterium]|nr:AMP-binding protein [Smithellaceae bacterium]
MLYEEKPWLKNYPPGVPHKLDIPMDTVGESFDRSTERWANQDAIVFYGKTIKYKELRDKVDRFATALSKMGVKKGDVVAFLLLNSPEHIIAFFAVLKLGAIVTPISPVYVSSEIKHQIEDSGAQTLICQDFLYQNVERTGILFKNIILTNITDSLPRLKRMFGKSIVRKDYEKMVAQTKTSLKNVDFHMMKDLIEENPPEPPSVKINVMEDVATLPFTGGTTGVPKGVMITHHNLISHNWQYFSFYPFIEAGKEVLVAYMPFYHAGGQTMVLQGVFRGYKLVVLTTPEPDDILHSCVLHGATFFQGTPAIYEIFKDYKKARIVHWRKLKIITSGADTLNESTAVDWKDKTGTELHDIYGLTELTCLSHGSPLGKNKIGSIGIPFPNLDAAILDAEKDEFVPVGEMGEIAVSGPSVTTGYWKQPSATAECRVTLGGKTWWRTGDLGRMEEDGYFYIYDRKRDLIKYKGLRVYAREVEEVLKTNPKIKEAGVVGVPDVKVGQLVKAFVVLESEARGMISEQDIMDYCRKNLAPYKVPKIVEFVGEIPKTDVGKVSRRELKEGQEL